ncbi:MAG: YbaK/EbsC family protein [Firmicutes bacterium]|nr:YbaK/EbsC family protein [Bacillota bacterium]
MNSKIIIPPGYRSVIIPEGEYGKLLFCDELLDIQATQRNVLSCEDASFTRGYALGNEMKTSLLDTSSAGAIMVHIPGNKLLNLREVKYALKHEFGGGKQLACRASEETSKKLHCEYGTLNPFSEFLSSLPQFVSEDLFWVDHSFVGTNAGTLNRYVKFDPAILHLMKKYTKLVIGSFSKDPGGEQ